MISFEYVVLANFSFNTLDEHRMQMVGGFLGNDDEEYPSYHY